MTTLGNNRVKEEEKTIRVPNHQHLTITTEFYSCWFGEVTQRVTHDEQITFHIPQHEHLIIRHRG